MPCDLASAEIRATLTSGTTVVATFNGNSHGDEGDKDKDKNKDKDKDKDKDKNKDQDQIADKGQGGKDTKGLNPKARPNPLNPQTMLSFTMSREGRVRVTVYDMQGRLVKTLLDEVRPAGEQRLSWDGSNARSQKVASGVYFFRIQAPEGDVIHRVAVVK
ncbi:MAG TPA: FlgD immunoglobulin-like domain containing protein [Candidatus Angelobacter sp.]|nr:FlgD immunoglobulin-like domain containing protein [Candidatus Angelobacter sp.]